MPFSHGVFTAHSLSSPLQHLTSAPAGNHTLKQYGSHFVLVLTIEYSRQREAFLVVEVLTVEARVLCVGGLLLMP